MVIIVVVHTYPLACSVANRNKNHVSQSCQRLFESQNHPKENIKLMLFYSLQKVVRVSKHHKPFKLHFIIDCVNTLLC